MARKANKTRTSRKGSAAARGSSSGRYARSPAESWRARVHSPRITDVDERLANVSRATKRIKTDVQVDIVRSRRGR
jgi:hypothetical protein